MCATAYIYLIPGSKSYSTSSPTPHLKVEVYSKNVIAEGNLPGTPHVNPTPHLKLRGITSGKFLLFGGNYTFCRVGNFFTPLK